MLEDLRFAVRMLLRSPGFALAAAGTLVLGIVLNTAAFGVVNALWFYPLPFRDGDRLQVVRQINREKGIRAFVSWQDQADLAAQSRVFEGVASFRERTFNLSATREGSAEPVRVSGGIMSASALVVLGYEPLIGRGFTAEDEGSYDAVNGPPVVLISERLWRNRFASDPGIVGRTVKVDGVGASVVGVLPASFRFVYAGYQLVAPMPRDVIRSPRTDRSLQVLARLRPGVTPEQATAEVEGIAERLAASLPASNAGWSFRSAPFREVVFGQAAKMYPVLLAFAMLVLLIVCANVSNLLLAKVSARRKELAIRLSLGAGRWRIVRQMLTEGMLLAGAGGSLALVAASWVSSIAITKYPELAPFRVDWHVFGYTLLVSVAAGIAFGLAPALAVSRPDLNEVLKAGGRSITAGGQRLRTALVVAEMAFALMLLTGAGLLLRQVAALRFIDTGFAARSLLTAPLSLEGPRYAKPEARARFWREVTERAAAIPGVESAAIASAPPLMGLASPMPVQIAGRAVRTGGEYTPLVSSVAGPEYFATFGIRLIAGRAVTSADDARAPKVAVINETLAKHLWPGEAPASAPGQRIRAGEDGDWATVVGVFANVKQLLTEPPFPEVLVPAAQAAPASMALVLRTAAEPRLVAGALRREVRSLDPDLPLSELLTLDDIREGFYPRVMLGGLGIFAGVAVMLASLGLYGVISFVVAQRRHEMGIRMALGADRSAVVRLVLGQGLRLASAGVGLGLLGAFGVGRVLRGFLQGVNAADPLVFGSVTAMMCAVALAASAIPAWRTARVDPLTALHYE
ncbi:MAG TPA: ABC transporter permease [Bryobacteraceae bacterium]|nr:ABC transporter permease [Bryobacteraceae bacterium]